jgi:two-component system nitrate/nitrite response regulator NarL
MGSAAAAQRGPARIAIVDDHPVTRRGLEALLGSVPSITVVCAVADPRELPAPVDDLDVVVLDLYLDGDTPALDAVAELAGRTRVLVMSASRRQGDVLGAIRAGASGYLTKRTGTELIVSAVETVAAGGFALSPQLADLLQVELSRAARQPDTGERSAVRRPALAPREEEALGWIARGFTHSQTATRMGVSKATIDTYVERIRSKLQVGNKAELTRVALERLADRPAAESPVDGPW